MFLSCTSKRHIPNLPEDIWGGGESMILKHIKCISVNGYDVSVVTL